MIDLPPPFRVATSDDAAALADLVNFAGDGMPLHLWTGMAAPGEDPWEVGRARQAAKAAEGQIVVADLGDGAVASLTGYAIGPDPETIGDETPALFRPLIELENAAPETWYVNVLAAYPDQRGKGLGRALLDIAERLARAEGLSRMSVIVADSNGGARNLYERQGYAEVATRPADGSAWGSDVTGWVLLVKSL